MATKIYPTLFIIVVFSGFIYSMSHTAPGPAPLKNPQSEDSGKYALLIGIDKYKNGITPLNGAVGDVFSMKRLLTSSKFGFPDDSDHVKVLHNQLATRKNIMDAFYSHLIENAKAFKERTGKEATIFFHFAGHGSQVKPPEGLEGKEDEPDGLDETIVPVDSSRDGSGKTFDIRDDEIFALVSELSEYTSNVVYVFDSCNSGTVNRGEQTAREVSADKRKQPAYQIRKVAANNEKDKNYDDLLLGSDKYVFIAGAQSQRKSYEIVVAGNMVRGALSFYLELALQNASPLSTYGELMRRVATEVNIHNSDQEPQLAGDKRRRILGGKFEEGEIPIPVVLVNNGQKTVTIGAGATLGLKKGSLIAIRNKEGVTVAEGEITSIENSSAVARFTLLGNQSINKDSDTVILLSPLFGAEPVRVVLPLSNRANSSVSDASGDAILKVVGERLTSDAKELFQIVYNGPGPAGRSSNDGGNGQTINVRRSSFKNAFCGGINTSNLSKAEVEKRCGILIPEPRVADEVEVFYLAPSGSGEPVFDFYVRITDNKAAEKITDALKKYARQKNLLALENRGGRLARDLKIEFIEVLGHFNVNEEFVTDSEHAIPLNDGVISKTTDIFYRLRISNQSEIDLYITVLGLSTDGAINALYPEESQEKLSAGKAHTTGLYMTARPYGTERIKIIITRDLSDFSPLAQGAVPKDVRSAGNPLNRLMNQAMSGTRGESASLALNSDDWDVAEVLLRILFKKSDVKKVKIKLTARKPLMLPPLITDDESGDDNEVRLISKLGKLLEAESSYTVVRQRGGKETHLVYVNSQSFPGGMKITGRYKVEGDKVRIVKVQLQRMVKRSRLWPKM